MPRYLDQVALGRALQERANPLLEAIAANDALHTHYLKRFESDEPPQYDSDSSSEYDEDDAPPEDPNTIIERPFDEDEIKRIASALGPQISPGQLYLSESKREEKRIIENCRGSVFHKPKGIRRIGIVARHNMKKRWGRLGIWNPAWGFAGRNVKPNDNFYEWRWKWDQDDGEGSVSHDHKWEEGLIKRKLLIRKKLRRGEYVRIVPQPALAQDATASQAESYFTSRPWFMFELEVTEEKQRLSRISFKDQHKLPQTSSIGQVIERWKVRGDWRDEYDEEGVTSWTWKDESHSPEPEDLTPIQSMDDLDSLDATVMDFTPSELDELETNELPWEEQPETYWVISKGMEDTPAFPGQMPEGHSHDHHSDPMPIARSATAGVLGSRKEAPESATDKTPLSVDASEQKPLDPQERAVSHTPQQARRGRPRQLKNETRIANGNIQSSPAPRRSARLAGTKRPAESAPTAAAPSKRPRGRKASSAGQPTGPEPVPTKKRSAPKRLPAGGETKAMPKQGRGRPKKEVPNSAPAKTVTKGQSKRGPGRGRPRKGDSGPGPSQENTPKRGRGRPRKETTATTRSSISKKK
ncbi:uncharacterized protein CCOS01_11130 [Colletotrichum costaricense]|uniref:AT hook domain-containing protein n=1 Tax=Colletotrichum costaricense TaxID=1209916 RepID=A0AAI9YQ34_9PEZI|nr:uncharacterized protein CCOS01_11130 [Colletotrichum costaricense]KAK1519479.1 hypothetical protein CCOS01_11130 [Colletotrichum costaricense]